MVAVNIMQPLGGLNIPRLVGHTDDAIGCIGKYIIVNDADIQFLNGLCQ